MSAKILHVLCEGQTEQGFVEKVLKPYLMDKGVTAVKSILVTTNKKLNASGGMLSYEQVVKDLKIMMCSSFDGEYESHIFTTMFDLYALPSDFPGYEDAVKIQDKYLRVGRIEQAFYDDNNDDRFIPYIQLHEFEALVFCGLQFLKDKYPDCDRGCKILEEALKKQPNPELINDNPHTAPSKRITVAIEQKSNTRYKYNKPNTGKYITERVGIDELRKKCLHFDKWIERIIERMTIETEK